MNRLNPRQLLLAAALATLAGAAFAQSSTDAHDHGKHDTAKHGAHAQAQAGARTDRYCIRETGSRIPAASRVSSDKAGKDCLAARGRVYTRQDIDATGRVDLADALRSLDPSIR